MSGNKAGGLKARDTNYLKNGSDFYKRIGAIGGKKGTFLLFSGAVQGAIIGGL
jgi:hypothetical protein